MNSYKKITNNSYQGCSDKSKNKLMNESKAQILNKKNILSNNENALSKITYIYHDKEEKKYTTDCSDLFNCHPNKN
jgi:hypothetical protein